MADRVAWPAITFEEHPWSLSEGVLVSRRARARARRPYRAAVPPAIAGLEVELPADVLAAAEDASLEIARFDEEVGSEIAPFSALLLRTESAASSKIENLTASARAIAEAELGHGGANATLIVANERAMRAALELADGIDGPGMLAMHAALLSVSAAEIAGRWRDQQVWIGGGDHGPHGAVFVPPHHSRVPAAIDDLVRFARRTDIPTLAHASLVHAQFETIHPFVDGNGRVGRALVHAQLRAAGLTRHVTVPVSAGLLGDVDGYFGALGAYRTGDVVPLVERFTRAAFAALANGRTLADDLRAVREGWQTRITARRDSRTWGVVELLLRQPVINAAVVHRELGVGVTNVYRVLRPLLDSGVIVEFTNKKRDRLWRAPDVLHALDAFAVRAGRRHRSDHGGS